mgnify:CR=1 FL=1
MGKNIPTQQYSVAIKELRLKSSVNCGLGVATVRSLLLLLLLLLLFFAMLTGVLNRLKSKSKAEIESLRFSMESTNV